MGSIENEIKDIQLKNLVDRKSNFIIELNRVAQLGFNTG